MHSLDREPPAAERESGVGVAIQPEPVSARSAVADASATPTIESVDQTGALRQEIARLERLRRHLQKDIVVKDAYVAALRADLRAKESEVAGLHESIRQTLSQPRYRAVDSLNAALRRVTFLHVHLKRWLTRQCLAEPPSSDPSPAP